MYIIDGIAYAGDKSPAIKAVCVKPLDDFKLEIRFSTGETKRVCMTSLLDSPAFSPLKNETLFRAAYIDYGAVCWDDGNIDIAPEYLYEHGIAAGGA